MQPLSASQRRELLEAVEYYEAALEFDPAVLAYLEDRGLTEETIRTNRLGVVSNAFPGHSRFDNFLVIPYLDRNNQPLTVRFRCLEDHNHRDFGHGKYMSITDDIARMYNVKAIHQAKYEIHVTEGEFDALILNQCGLPAVAIPGASGWKPHYRRMLAGFNVVYVWPDPDDAGAKFSNAIQKAMYSARAVRLEHGDVNDTFHDHGGLKAIIDAKAASDEMYREAA